MTPDNGERLKIVMSMEDPFDYREFADACLAEGVDLLSENEYGQKVGWLMLSLRKYPELEPLEGYLKFIGDINKIPNMPAQGNQKGCCGGGKVI